MKKYLFFLFALICTTSLFTACSDDEEDNGWKEIPTEIPAENVTLNLNGNTPEGATASLKIETAETGVLTLDNVLYGRASVPVNVVMKKVAEGSYDFEGTANIDGATKANAATDLGLTVNVKGNVTKEGKLTVDVTTSGWGSISGVYSGDSVKVTYAGTESNKFPVTVTATSESKATLNFSKIVPILVDFDVEVTLTKDGEGYKLEGTGEKEPGYNVNVAGTIIKNVLTVNVTTSGYATINSSYYANSANNALTYNGVETEKGSIYIKATSETAVTISVNGMIPGSNSISINGKLTKADDGSYSMNGSANTEGYEIAFEGTVTTDKKMTGAVTYKILSPVVGKWGPKMGQQGAETIFNFASKTGSVKFPKEIVDMLPADLKPYFGETMGDAQLTQSVKGLLGKYLPQLQYIEFTEGGDINFAYTEIGKTEVQTLNGYLNYYIKEGQVYLVFDLQKLMGMLKSSTTKAWDPGTFLSDGIPFDFNVTNGTMNFWLSTTTLQGLIPVAGNFIKALSGMFGDKAELIVTVLDTVMGITAESTEFEVGLVLNKK